MTSNFILFVYLVCVKHQDREIELKHCASSKTSVKSSRKYFVHLNWIRLAIPIPVDSIAQWVERRSRYPKMRVQTPARANEFFVGPLQCQNNMKLVFRISEDGSEIVHLL